MADRKYDIIPAADVREGDETWQGGSWGPVKRVEVHGEGPGAWLFIEWPSGMTMAGEPVHYRTFRRPVAK